MTPQVRKIVYAVIAAAGAACVALGWLDPNLNVQLLAIVGGLLAVGAGGLAIPHVAPAPTIDTAPIMDALARQAGQAVSDGVAAVDAARADIERRLGH